MTDQPADGPLFEVAGGATPEEIAALTAVLAAATAAHQDATAGRAREFPLASAG